MSLLTSHESHKVLAFFVVCVYLSTYPKSNVSPNNEFYRRERFTFCIQGTSVHFKETFREVPTLKPTSWGGSVAKPLSLKWVNIPEHKNMKLLHNTDFNSAEMISLKIPFKRGSIYPHIKNVKYPPKTVFQKPTPYKLGSGSPEPCRGCCAKHLKGCFRIHPPRNHLRGYLVSILPY